MPPLIELVALSRRQPTEMPPSALPVDPTAIGAIALECAEFMTSDADALRSAGAQSFGAFAAVEVRVVVVGSRARAVAQPLLCGPATPKGRASQSHCRCIMWCLARNLDNAPRSSAGARLDVRAHHHHRRRDAPSARDAPRFRAPRRRAHARSGRCARARRRKRRAERSRHSEEAGGARRIAAHVRRGARGGGCAPLHVAHPTPSTWHTPSFHVAQARSSAPARSRRC